MVADLTRDGRLVTPRIDSLTKMGASLSRPVPAGTVVMAVSGNVGLTAIVEVYCCIHDGFVAFTELDVRSVTNTFLSFCLSLLQSTHDRTMAGAIFKNITTYDVKAMPIIVPPVDLQREFERHLAVAENFRKSLIVSGEAINCFSNSFITESFGDFLSL